MAACLDCCLVLADRPQGTIYVAWYAHMKTSRIAGVRIKPTAHKVENDATWETTVQWTAGNFKFHACPILRIDIQTAMKEGVVLGPLRCYTKDADASTILAVARRPTQLHPKGLDPVALLPPTAMVSWA
ncbi:MAG: hypothetical protein AB2556_23190 [Candidatus Thiodiazotropha sp.]